MRPLEWVPEIAKGAQNLVGFQGPKGSTGHSG